MRVLLIGNPHVRRTALLREAVRRRGDTLVLLPWIDVLSGRIDLRSVVLQNDVVRIDSPGKDFSVERKLLRMGGVGDSSISARVEQMTDERGRVWWPAVWYRGFCAALEKIAGQLAECPEHVATANPSDIATMFDKPATHARLHAAGIPVPPAIGRVVDHEELISQMQRRGWQNVFVKLAHGSSASGAIALRTAPGGKLRAFTTVELDGVDDHGEPRIYNTRRIRSLTSESDVAAVVNAIAAHRVHVERWLPKAGIDGQTFDIRVLVIAGRACHTVVRMSRTPITNLHLLNDRAEPTRLRERCGDDAWRAAMESCERSARLFPESLYAGVDLLISPDFRRHAVLELNAFGDLLPGAVWNGLDTYDAEMAAVCGDGCFAPVTAEVA